MLNCSCDSIVTKRTFLLTLSHQNVLTTIILINNFTCYSYNAGTQACQFLLVLINKFLWFPSRFLNKGLLIYQFLVIFYLLQKAFVTERSELIENNRKKWDTSMQQRRDKEVTSDLSYFLCA